MSARVSDGGISFPEFIDQFNGPEHSTLAPDEVRELIARRAYELYENRGDRTGNEISDWLKAEEEIATMLLSLPLEPAGIEVMVDLPSTQLAKVNKTPRKKSINGTPRRKRKRE